MKPGASGVKSPKEGHISIQGAVVETEVRRGQEGRSLNLLYVSPAGQGTRKGRKSL